MIRLSDAMKEFPDCVFTKDTECRFLRNNDAHLKLLGASRQEEVQGKTDFDFFSRADAERFYADDRHIIETGEPLTGREESYVNRQGERRWVSTTKVPMRDQNGKVIGLVGVSRDVTEHVCLREALRASKAMSQAVFDSVLVGMIVFDSDGNVLSSNKAAQRILGPAIDELTASRLSNFPYELQDEHGKPMSIGQTPAVKCRRSGAVEGPMIIGLNHSDRLQWLKAAASPIQLADGAAVINCFEDVTEWKRLEDEVQMLEAAIRSSDQQIVITDANLEGEGPRIVFVNAAFSRLVGYTPAEAVGQPAASLLLPPERIAKGQSIIEALRRHGRFTGEVVHLSKDKTLIPVDLTISKMCNSSGEVTHFVSLGSDITERKQTESALRKALEEVTRFREMERQVLATIPSICIGLHANGEVTNWNRAAETQLGIAACDALGRQFKSLAIDWMWQEIDAAISRCVSQCEQVRMDDVRFKDAAGRNRILGLTLSPIQLSNRSSEGLVVVGADVTERRHAESQQVLTQKMESLGALSAGIAHEINTPTQYVGDNIRFLQGACKDLSTLIGKYRKLAEAVKEQKDVRGLVAEVDKAEDEADLSFLLEEIPMAIEHSIEGVESVAKIVRAMKEFSHPDREDSNLVDLNRAVESTATISRNEWKYVANLELDLDPDLPPVSCRVGEINQVVLNLIVNAAQAIAGTGGRAEGCKGRILVSTRTVNNTAEIRVADDGPGIPESIRHKVFDPFFTTKGVGRGSGQGLALAHNIVVRKHGGVIRFKTETGRGTTFIVRLPLE